MAKHNDKEFMEFDAHFPFDISGEIHKYFIDDVLEHSRYVFIRRAAGVQFGYCTHCQKRFKTESPLKHNEKTSCPKCNSICKVKNHGTSRKYLYDKAFVVYYEKSQIDSQAIIARAFNICRDYAGDYTKVKTSITVLAKYLFKPGEAIMYEDYWWGKNNWSKCNSVHSIEPKSFSANNRCNEESIRKAIAGTPFQYSTWDQHDQPQWDYVKFFALYSKYPAVEYLTKLGYKYFVGAKLFDRKTFNCINWRGKNINQILRLNKQDFKEVQRLSGQVNPMQLRLYQLSRKDNNHPTIREIIDFFPNSVGDVMDRLSLILRYTTLRRIMNYLRKQIRISETYRTYPDLLTAWRDYIRDCEALEYDLATDLILFPKDLHEAHQRTIQLVQVKADEMANLKFQKRAEILNRYCFEYGDLIIRPALSVDELINEGKKLQHCVARYADDHANGKTSIFVIRRKSEPNKPFYTMEIRKDQIWQTRGFENNDMTDEVRSFVRKFTAARLKKKAPAKPKANEGVAV